MHLLWVAPAAVVVLGLLAVAVAAARAADEARGLRRSTGRLADLRPALVELRRSTDDVRRTAQGLRDR